jgi:hypothetical protein
MSYSASRIEGISDERAGLFARFVFWLTRRKLRKLDGNGRVVGPVRVMAHHPTLLATYGSFESGLERCRKVPERLKSLAMIRAATLVGCPF